MSDKAEIAYFPMGQWPAYVGFTMSPKAFRREMKRLKVDGPPAFLLRATADATTHFLEKNGVMTFIVAMRKSGKRAPEQVAGVISHEAMHIIQWLWAELGEREPGKESEAYLMQHIVQCCLQEAWATGRERRVTP